jgi:hypothetical protein
LSSAYASVGVQPRLEAGLGIVGVCAACVVGGVLLEWRFTRVLEEGVLQ